MKKLETQRLWLREMRESDFSAVHSYASTSENTVFMPWGPNTEEQTRAFLSLAAAEANRQPCVNYQYAVTLKSTGRLIGGCSLALSGDEAELGWVLSLAEWNQGYGTEIGKALLKFGFDELNLHRIIARCDAENIASYRVMEKIGMLREGLFLESRPGRKGGGQAYGDTLSYAILKSDWDAQKEIAYYNSLPCVFNDFITLPTLSNGQIQLVCVAKKPPIPEKKWVPAYVFVVCKGSEKIGELQLRIGYDSGLYGSNLYYGGQIGYSIDEAHRGNGYAAQACRLLEPVAKAHQMETLLITNAHTNTASRRVCEKLGARLLRVARLPEWHDIYQRGHRFVNIFEWSLK